MLSIEQVLIFKIGEITYAVDSDLIAQINHAPELTNVPLTAHAIRGISPIEGVIISVYDSNRLLGNEGDVDITNYKSRMITIKTETLHIGLLVDEVLINISLDPSSVELNEDVKKDHIAAFIKMDDTIVQLIAIESLLSTVQAPHFKKAAIHDKLSQDEVTKKSSQKRQILTFGMDNEKYAISSHLVREILLPTDDITVIVDSDPEVIGMITLRNKVLVALDLRTIFGMQKSQHEKSRYIIVERENSTLAFYVDMIDKIIDINIEDIEIIPEKFKNDNINGVIEIKGELTSLISDTFIKNTIAQAKSTVQNNQVNVTQDSEDQEDEISEEVVIFDIENEKYAFDIEEVEEIIKLGTITPLPESPDFINGIINLRGEIIPIVSLHKRLGFKEKIFDSSKVFVCRILGQKIGFIVDAITDVTQIKEENIASKSHKNKLFSEVIVLEKSENIILKLATNCIFTDAEFEAVLSEVQKELLDA